MPTISRSKPKEEGLEAVPSSGVFVFEGRVELYLKTADMLASWPGPRIAAGKSRFRLAAEMLREPSTSFTLDRPVEAVPGETDSFVLDPGQMQVGIGYPFTFLDHSMFAVKNEDGSIDILYARDPRTPDEIGQPWTPYQHR
jgi:hypothetical protein